MKEVTGQLEAWKESSLEASGAILAEAYRKEIVDAGLIDEGTWLGSVTHVVDGDTAYAGTPLDNPPYPFFLEFSFIHHQSGERVGPYFPLTKAAAASEEPLRRAWGTL